MGATSSAMAMLNALNYMQQICSISLNSSTVKASCSKTRKLSVNCSTELAPTITDVILSSLSTHANAISANVCPRRRAISFNCRAASIFSGVTCER